MNKRITLIDQYNEIKKKYKDTIILFQVGDFYELFDKDAEICSNILGLVLTTKKINKNLNLKFAGFPCYTLENYLPKLVKYKLRIAICNQITEKKKSNNDILDRKITQIITPGIISNNNFLNSKSNNYLCSIILDNHIDKIGISFIDISTGEFLTAEDNFKNIYKLINNYSPKEIIYNKSQKEKILKLFNNNNYYLYKIENYNYDFEYCYEILINHFKVLSLKCFG